MSYDDWFDHIREEMEAEREAPCDWDHESYCCVDGCHNPATHELLDGMIDDHPLYEMVCCRHAAKPVEKPSGD